jgi:hypothetical protein
VSDWGDYGGDMFTRRPLDDASVEAVLRGGQVPAELEPLAGAVRMIRSTALETVRPSAELASRMATGVFPVDDVKRSTLSKLAAMSLRAKIATGFAAALTGLTGATAAGALPDAAQQRVETAIESVTPIDFPESAEFGQEVAEDARDGGVDGQEISEKAHERGNQPDDPGAQGKADEHRPADVPAGPPTALPTPDQVPPGPPADIPIPDDRPGADPTEPPEDLPADAKATPPIPR